LVWTKVRNSTEQHALYDTNRGATKYLFSNTTAASVVNAASLTSFNSNGFTLGDWSGGNFSDLLYASWTFREQAKFFDVVTWTGNGVLGREISHSLGSVPGSIIVKCTSNVVEWVVYHRFDGTTAKIAKLNTTAAAFDNNASWFGNGSVAVSPTSSVFTVSDDPALNNTGYTYVAYVYAHNAGGFGLTGTDNVISCGTFTTNPSNVATVNLGYEPQWIMAKRTDSATEGDWLISDVNRRWMVSGGRESFLAANLSTQEGQNSGAGVYSNTDSWEPNSTGFRVYNYPFNVSSDYIYIAIRRGPMKVPTTGTSVFGLNARTGTGAIATVTGGQTDDAVLVKNRGSVASLFSSRLTGTNYLVTSTTAAEVAAGTTILQALPWDVMDGVKVGTTSTITNSSGATYINYLFKRAPSVFDVVCYTGTGSATTVTHNLQAVPELIICKQRSAVRDWGTGWGSLGWTARGPALNSTETSFTVSTWWNNTAPTSSVFTVGTSATTNQSGQTFVAYLFATCAGVSKVGSYTGTGTTKQIDCGFASGARFVLIKRTDSTGDWYVWDSARGIVSGNDPYLLMNSSSAEVTSTDYIDTYSAGFEISSTAPAAINASGGTFIFLAIA
jgi:hypothetical protein